MDAAENRAVDNLVDKIDHAINRINSWPNLPRPYADLYNLVKNSLPFLPDLRGYNFFVWANLSGVVEGKYQFRYKSGLGNSFVSIDTQDETPREYVVIALFKTLYFTRVSPAGRLTDPIAINDFMDWNIPLP